MIVVALSAVFLLQSLMVTRHGVIHRQLPSRKRDSHKRGVAFLTGVTAMATSSPVGDYSLVAPGDVVGGDALKGGDHSIE